VLDSELSRNWDAVTQNWTPTPSLTTFDFVPHYEVLGLVVDGDGSSLQYQQIAQMPHGTGGVGYEIGDIIRVAGNQIGGVNEFNDITIVVQDVDSGGAVTIINVDGEAPITLAVNTEYNNITGTNIIGSGASATFSFIVSNTVDSMATTFDGASLQFQQPLDMYNPTDRNDKYLVFPKANILV